MEGIATGLMMSLITYLGFVHVLGWESEYVRWAVLLMGVLSCYITTESRPANLLSALCGQVFYLLLLPVFAGKLAHYLVNLIFGQLALLDLLFGFMTAMSTLSAGIGILLPGPYTHFVRGQPPPARIPLDPNAVTAALKKTLPDRSRISPVSRATPASAFPSVLLGGLETSAHILVKNVLLVGSIGSGKTLSLLMLICRLLPLIGKKRNFRALVFDPKREFYAQLRAMGVMARIVVLNPFDARCSPWAICCDIRDAASALQFATTVIVQDKKDPDPHWIPTAQGFGAAVATELHQRCPGDWYLRDFVLLLENPTYLRLFLEKTPHETLLGHLEEPRHAQSVLSTLTTSLRDLRLIAALWDRATEEPVSLEDWIDPATPDYILLLGRYSKASVAIDALNRAFFQRMAEILLHQPKADLNTLLVLDEVAKAGELPLLPDLATEGRSRGIGMVSTAQTTGLILDAYGELPGKAIMSQSATRAYLKMGDADSAEWTSRELGEYEAITYYTSETRGKETSFTHTPHLEKRFAVLPSELTSQDETNYENGLTAFYESPELGAFCTTIPGSYLFDEVLAFLKNEDVSLNFVQRNPRDQILRPLDAADFKRLGIDPLRGPALPLPPTPKPETPDPPRGRANGKKRSFRDLPDVPPRRGHGARNQKEECSPEDMFGAEERGGSEDENTQDHEDDEDQ